MDEDAIDIELRAPSEVAGRCIVLAALLRRLSLESLDTNTHAEERSTDAFDILLWLRSEGFGDTLTSSELDHLSRPVGDLREEENRAFVEPAEGLTTLGWALNLGDSLAFHQTAEVATLISSIPSPWEDTSSWLRAAQLRTEDEIARERERTEVTFWRIRIEPER
ncbi:MAG: DUF4272 domain-containing protein, partial [Chloroflexia bacterium]|nr:DUF4272 domain-containing protein [Chloroflexia bacterium]